MVYTKKIPNTKRVIHNKIIDLINNNSIDTAFLLINKHFKKSSKEYLFFYGWINQIQKKHNKAIQYLENTLLLDPYNEEVLLGLAISYDAIGDFNKALECCEHARILFKESANVLLTFAAISRKAGVEPYVVIDLYIEALRLLVDNSENTELLLVNAYIGIGSCLLDMRDYNNAEVYFNKATNIDFYNALAHKNLSNVYAAQGLIDKAIESAKIAQGSNDAEVAISSKYMEGMLQLAKKNYVVGWRAHEARLLCSDYKAKKLLFNSSIKLGDIKPTSNILVFQEQGIGDTLQFSRYLPMLAKQCGNIDLLIQPNHYVAIGPNIEVPSIKSFLHLNYGKYIQNIFVDGVNNLPKDYDAHISLMSLPYLFNTTVSTVPAPPNFITDISLTDKAYDIGICWQGSKHHYNDINRSIPWTIIEEFMHNNSSLTFTYLQLENNKHISTLEATLALIKSCSIIITVDSMIAHLAASAGSQTWLLLPYSSDWRWGTKETASEWYPSVRIFRQKQTGDWDSVLAEVTAALKLTKF